MKFYKLSYIHIIFSFFQKFNIYVNKKRLLEKKLKKDRRYEYSEIRKEFYIEQDLYSEALTKNLTKTFYKKMNIIYS